MFIFIRLIFLFFVFSINGCTLNNFKEKKDSNNFSIEIYAPNDKYNLYFKENLKRYFDVVSKWGGDIIIRVTGDSILIDPKLVDNFITKFKL